MFVEKHFNVVDKTKTCFRYDNPMLDTNPPLSLAREVLWLVLDEAGHEDAVQDGLRGGGHHVRGEGGVVQRVRGSGRDGDASCIAHNHWL